MHPTSRYAFWLPAVAMMLGWGLRGFIGGGPFGAMIPGAMVALTLCLLYPRRRDTAMVAAFAAIGVGIGGEMTYGQTVGFIIKAETFWWGFLGLGLKGAIWGALAGAVISLGFTPRPMLVLSSGAVISAATWAGWKFINEPKLIYFSHPTDKPRPEIWAGFLLAAIALVAFLGKQGKLQPALRFSVAGFAGGFIGFGFGGAIQGLGRIFTPELNLHWWKYMEFFFGLCFGWALAWAWRHSDVPEEDFEENPPSLSVELAGAAVITAALFWLSWNTPVRFAYLLAGAATLYILTKYRWLAKHVAYSVTFTGYALDLARYWSREYKRGPAEPAYAAAVLGSFVFAYYVVKYKDDTARLLNLLTWSAVVIATIKFAIHPNGISNVIDHVCIGFILMAIAVTRMTRSTLDRDSCAPVSPSSSASPASLPSS